MKRSTRKFRRGFSLVEIMIVVLIMGVLLNIALPNFVNARETSRRAVVEPLVDFTALDLVGVVVPGGTTGRGTIKAEGSRR